MTLAYRIVETELSFVYQLQNDRPGKGLGDATYANVLVGCNRSTGLQVSGAEGLDPRSFTRNIYVDERPRNPQVSHLLFDLRL